MAINVKGVVVDNDTATFYDYFGIDFVSPKSISDAMQNESDTIDLDISSNGGDVFAASEIYTMLKKDKRPVNVIISGLAASAASVIAMAGDKVSISPTAQIMIHRASSVVQGNKNDMKNEQNTLEGIDRSIALAYENKTNLEEDQLLEMMDNQTWIGAKDAVKYGFADEILFVDEKRPQVVNSTAEIISQTAVNKFLNLITQSQPPKKEASLLDHKLAILKEKD